MFRTTPAGSVQPSGNMTPSLRGKKQSPESMIGNSDGRYAPMGNTSSVIDGEPSHAPRALLLRIWRAVFPAVIGNIPQTPADMLSHLWIPIPRSPVVKSCLHPTAQIGRPVSLNDASGLTILTVSPPGSVSIRQDFFWKRVAFHPLFQGCPAVGFPTRISIRNSFEDGESQRSPKRRLKCRHSPRSKENSPVGSDRHLADRHRAVPDLLPTQGDSLLGSWHRGTGRAIAFQSHCHARKSPSRVIDARSSERPLCSTSQPANIASGVMLQMKQMQEPLSRPSAI